MEESEPKLGQSGTADSEAVVVLRRAIVRGELTPNEHLVESLLAERYGFSRGAIRTALLELGHEGLVERERNRGARVRMISFDEAIELTEVRMVLEGFVAAKAARFATEEDVALLWRLFEQMRLAASTVDLLQFADINVQLHGEIGKISRQALAGELVNRLRNQGVRYRFVLALVPGRPAESISDHHEILSAIAAGDSNRARASMELHFLHMIEGMRSVADMGARI